MRQYIIAGNWKMNKTVSESVELAKAIVEAVKDVKKTEVVIAPTYLAPDLPRRRQGRRRHQGFQREARHPGHPLEGPGRIHR